jgi:hypothetical protein
MYTVLATALGIIVPFWTALKHCADMYTVRATALGIIVPFWTALMTRIWIKRQQTNTNIERFENAI